MRAIQIRYLAPTNTKPARLKVWSYKSKSLTVDKTDDDRSWETQMHVLAERYIELMGWKESIKITGWGRLPDGDDVITLCHA